MHMHLIVEQRGVFVSKHQGRLRVEKDKQRLAEVPIMHLEQVLICQQRRRAQQRCRAGLLPRRASRSTF